MALTVPPALAPGAALIAIAVALDFALGDPVYRLHPVRLIGSSLSLIERMLRRIGLDGYGGGIILFVILAVAWVTGASAAIVGAGHLSIRLGRLVHLFVLYSLLALGDLLHHVMRIENAVARGDLTQARQAVSQLVGRDTRMMDAAACRRAAVESLSENLTDGFTSPLFWYAVGGIPGLVLFKVVSTMDSMVGYKTPAYLRFGWCGARLDDVMNFVPARLTWLMLGAVAALIPRCSASKAWRVGLAQHGVLPGPNSGWSEAATAGALQRRLVGPIWMRGRLVTDTWIGDPDDPPLATSEDVRTARALVAAVGVAAAVVACAALAAV